MSLDVLLEIDCDTNQLILDLYDFKKRNSISVNEEYKRPTIALQRGSIVCFSPLKPIRKPSCELVTMKNMNFKLCQEVTKLSTLNAELQKMKFFDNQLKTQRRNCILQNAMQLRQLGEGKQKKELKNKKKYKLARQVLKS